MKRFHLFLIFFLTIITSCFVIYPVLKGGLIGVFFSIDPDVHYIGNSLSYIKINQIQYTNHPATPSIMLYAYLLTPLRFISKYVFHTNFILWSVEHIDQVYFYLRILQTIIFGIAILLLLISVYKLTKSFGAVLFSYLALFSFRFFPFLGVYIRSETTSFFITALWFMVFTLFLRYKTKRLIFLLSVISGLAVANKFTNIFYFIASIFLFVMINNLSTKNKTSLVFGQLFIGILTFFVATWPIRTKYYLVFNLVKDLFTHTDLMGKGKKAIFDLSNYASSALMQIKEEPWASVIILSIFLVVTYYWLIRKKIDKALLIVAYIIILGIIIFAKYPWSYYQTSNYIAIVFVGSFMFTKITNFYKTLIISVLILIVFLNFTGYYKSIFNSISTTKNLEKYIIDHPAKIATIWEWGRAKDFALLWGNSWSGGSYSDELKKKRPDLLFEIDYYKKTTPHYNDKIGVFGICWDKLYIQQQSLSQFINKYPDHNFTYNQIPESGGMAIIESYHCDNKK